MKDNTRLFNKICTEISEEHKGLILQIYNQHANFYYSCGDMTFSHHLTYSRFYQIHNGSGGTRQNTKKIVESILFCDFKKQLNRSFLRRWNEYEINS